MYVLQLLCLVAMAYSSPQTNTGDRVIFPDEFKRWQQNNREICAVANIFGGGISGEQIGQVMFSQSNSSAPVTVEGNIQSLTYGKHGFHIHQYGSTEEGCSLAKGHFNPFFVAHGSRQAPERHVGDLGNIVADDMGIADFTFTDSHITLYQDSVAHIIGRAVVVHAGEDDLGLGGDIGSFKTGNAGGRVGCGVIGLTKCSAKLKKSEGLIAQASLYRDAASTKGLITFHQESPTSPVTVRGMVLNFNQHENSPHGFHIHEFGDTSNNCKAAGGHFNPDGVVHGAPQDSVRHVGDLGNIRDVNGTAKFCIRDRKITLYSGVNSIIGRAVVVHQGEDDLGRGGNEGSMASGNAGPRLTCGVVGYVDKNYLEGSISEDTCL